MNKTSFGRWATSFSATDSGPQGRLGSDPLSVTHANIQSKAQTTGAPGPETALQPPHKGGELRFKDWRREGTALALVASGISTRMEAGAYASALAFAPSAS